MPLEVKRAWTYDVTNGLESRIESVTAVRPIPVAGVQGMEFNGPLGVSRFAWVGNALVAQCTSNLVFTPPIPLLASNGKQERWAGKVTWMGRPIQATAEVSERPFSLTLVARTIESTESDLVLHLPSHTIELLTWFEPGVGIVKQEQRSGPKLEIGVEMVEGH